MAEMLWISVRLLVVLCLVCVVVQALVRARVNAGALCSTVAASSALTGEIDSAYSVSACAFAVARYVSQALGCAVLD